ncbi:MAG: hypothetical protein JW841_06985 [Deltaproteobacteria bacterium]|nr:hypothetical protein [Deltaproteobacteria bacterium]
MQRLLRKQVYLTAKQAKRINRRAKIDAVAEAQIIRLALDYGLDILETSQDEQRQRAYARLIAFSNEVAARGPVVGGRSWTRDELYDRGLR